MKRVYLTVDIEEWYDLEYIKQYASCDKSFKIIPEIIYFLDMLDRYKIKATFFVLGEHVRENADILRDIYNRGHQIGSHGHTHELLYNISDADFVEQIRQSREAINEAIGSNIVHGYRAPCFSADREKIDLLKKNGYKFDSSLISFEEHPLYNTMDLSDFEKISDLKYLNDSFLEVEIPTIKIWKFNIPISGGGYLRLFPKPIIFYLLNKFLKKNNEFLLYLHPFELSNIKIPLPKDISKIDKFRLEVGRKRNLKKVEEIIKFFYERDFDFQLLTYEPEDK
ncbi:DUF3473 domain-containing protein [Acidaminobacter sp. JC074]|uniref:polysaccharide deacetylase family protein n=1 Tax=Acidaminobacter sp. JC074 TaxID=2530199 RepID=UPI001F1062E8|nr:polysaccharide deacetylase family protein [Acidaminobacter sp. JC074]MCH4890646.1 DUF3473 domain-containing protein [Acidaminobacter sp. JC074]